MIHTVSSSSSPATFINIVSSPKYGASNNIDRSRSYMDRTTTTGTTGISNTITLNKDRRIGFALFYSNVPMTTPTTTTRTEYETKRSSRNADTVVRLPLRIPFHTTTQTMLEQALDDMVQSTVYMEQQQQQQPIPSSSGNGTDDQDHVESNRPRDNSWQWTCSVPAFQQYVHLQYIPTTIHNTTNFIIDYSSNTTISNANHSVENMFPYGYLELSLRQNVPINDETDILSENMIIDNNNHHDNDDIQNNFGWICLKFYEIYTTTHFVHIFDDTYELQPRVLLQHANVPAIHTAWTTNATSHSTSSTTYDHDLAEPSLISPTDVFIQHLSDQYTNIVPPEYRIGWDEPSENDRGGIKNGSSITTMQKISNIFHTLDTRGYIIIDPVTHTEHGFTSSMYDYNPKRNHNIPNDRIALLTTKSQRDALSQYFTMTTDHHDHHHRYAKTIRTDQIHFISSIEQAQSCHIVEQYNLLLGIPHFMNEVVQDVHHQRPRPDGMNDANADTSDNDNNVHSHTHQPQQRLSVPRSIQFAEYGYGDFYIVRDTFIIIIFALSLQYIVFLHPVSKYISRFLVPTSLGKSLGT
jgi:hypothetical protein